MTKVLIDADQFLYRGCAAVEREVRWDDENHILYSNSEEAYDAFEGSLRTSISALERRWGLDLPRDTWTLAFTKGTSFRSEVFPAYKSKRKNIRKPMCFVETRDRIEANYRCLSVPGLEADDILGILATKDPETQAIIVSDDKDLRTIPGHLWRMGELEHISPEQADRHWLLQTLMGDTSDGYPGCPGVGPKKAEDILATAENQWGAVTNAFLKAELTEEDALAQARCARILRSSDWDHKKKEVKLWEPVKALGVKSNFNLE